MADGAESFDNEERTGDILFTELTGICCVRFWRLRARAALSAETNPNSWAVFLK
jgi:hypothetical protein